MNRLQEILKRKKEIAAESRNKNLTAAEIRSLNEELDKLNLEQLQLEEERGEEFRSQYEGSNQPQGRLNPISTYSTGQQNGQAAQRSSIVMPNLEERAAQFESGRAVQFDMAESESRSITTTNVPLQGHASKGLNPGFNEVSSIVDLVKTIPLPGGESYKSGFVVSSGSADYTAESADYYDNQDVKTDYVQIDKAKITTYFELPEEVIKLGGTHYMGFAQQAAQTAIRKKMAQQIMIGTGGTNSLRGIFNAPANVIPVESDLEMAPESGSELPFDFLEQIVFHHGGDESVEGGAYLILNKQTLAAISEKTTANGDPLFKIKLDINGNVGTISSRDSFEVPFIINSVVKSWQNAAVGEYFMAYGKPLAYEVAQFSGIEVQQSRDFKFKSGQIAVKAVALVGGNTASYKGFTRVKKVAAV